MIFTVQAKKEYPVLPYPAYPIGSYNVRYKIFTAAR